MRHPELVRSLVLQSTWAGPDRVPPRHSARLGVDVRRRTQRAGDAGGVLPVDLHPAGVRRRPRRSDHRRRARVPAPAEPRGPPPTAAHVDRPRRPRPAAPDLGADACARRRRRRRHPPRSGPRGRRPHPRRRVPAPAWRGPPTVPGTPRRMERHRARVLGRASTLRSSPGDPKEQLMLSLTNRTDAHGNPVTGRPIRRRPLRRSHRPPRRLPRGTPRRHDITGDRRP